MSRPLALKPHSFRTVVLYNIFADIGGKTDYFFLLSQCRDLLTDDGVLIVCDNKAADGFFARSQADVLTYSVLEKQLEKLNFASINGYVSKNLIGYDLEPLPEYVIFDLDSEGYYTNNKLLRLKEMVSYYKPFKKKWPSYAFTASARNFNPELDEFVNSREIAEKIPASGQRLVTKRIFAGHDNVNIVICGVEGSDKHDVVVRMPMTAAGYSRCKHNHDAIAELKKDLGDLVPNAVYEGRFRTQPVFIEEKKPGGIIFEFNQELVREMDTAAHNWIEFQKRRAVTVMLDEDRYASLIGNPVTEIAGYCDDAIKSRVLKLEEAVSRVFLGRPLTLVPAHGDFKPSNILFSKSGKMIGIIDWDNFTREGVPLVDIFALIFYFENEIDGLPVHQSYSRTILGGKHNDKFNKHIDECKKAFKLDREQVQCLRILFWFINWKARADAQDMIHAEWRKNIIGNVLPDMNRTLGID